MAVINQKGGVGKTTSTVNIGAAVARAGNKVLMLDVDPQANLSLHLDRRPDPDRGTMTDLLVEGTPLVDLVTETTTPGLYMVPADTSLSGVEQILANRIGRETILREALEDLEAAGKAEPTVPVFDFILLDCPPSLGVLSANALVAANDVIIPMQAEYFSMQGMTKLMEVMQLVRRSLNPNLEICLILPCMVDRRTNLTEEVLSELGTHFGHVLSETCIRSNVKLAEAPSFGRTIFEHAPDSNGAADYETVADEFLRRMAGTFVPSPPEEEEEEEEGDEPEEEEEEEEEAEDATELEEAEPEDADEDSENDVPSEDEPSDDEGSDADEDGERAPEVVASTAEASTAEASTAEASTTEASTTEASTADASAAEAFATEAPSESGEPVRGADDLKDKVADEPEGSAEAAGSADLTVASGAVGEHEDIATSNSSVEDPSVVSIAVTEELATVSLAAESSPAIATEEKVSPPTPSRRGAAWSIVGEEERAELAELGAEEEAIGAERTDPISFRSERIPTEEVASVVVESVAPESVPADPTPEPTPEPTTTPSAATPVTESTPPLASPDSIHPEPAARHETSSPGSSEPDRGAVPTIDSVPSAAAPPPTSRSAPQAETAPTPLVLPTEKIGVEATNPTNGEMGAAREQAGEA